jgi:hypothetical protein
MGSTIPLFCASWVVAFESALEFPEETSTFGLQQRQNLHETSDPTFQSALHLVRLGRIEDKLTSCESA